jgi:hypothetical protein
MAKQTNSDSGFPLVALMSVNPAVTAAAQPGRGDREAVLAFSNRDGG